MSARAINMAGQRFGRLTVLRRGQARQKRGAAWDCLCDCGKTRTVHRTDLVKGSTISCGCYRRSGNLGAFRPRHGMTKSPTHRSWTSMLCRCAGTTDARTSRYYADRGIAVCDRWRTFENFLADMGKRPPGKSIDRIDNSRGYEPGNCRWATAKEQAANRRRPARNHDAPRASSC